MDGVIEDMWTPYKRLYDTCQSAIRNPNEMNSDLVQCLKKYKQNFTNFLRNPPKSEKSRAQLANASMEGVIITGQSRKTELSNDLVNEAIILSDMYDLDEIFALELLCTAQRQQMNHPGLPRGLVAVLLYYDGRKAISCTLRDMFQVASGVSWTTELPKEMTALINNYVQNLVEDSNILGRILDLLAEMDTEKEIVLLTKNRAFGSKRHKNQVLALYEGTRKALAMTLFNWSAQRGLSNNIAVRLLQQLATMKTSDVTVIMLMALLYAYDTSVLLLAECDNQHISRLPILNDPDYAKCFYEAIYAQTTWQIPQMDVIIKYSFGLTLASLRQSQTDFQTNAGAIINCDEQLIDEALAGNVFTFIYRELLDCNVVYETDFIYRRLHLLITDFIDFMHAKVTELRGRSHERARNMINFQNTGLETLLSGDDSFELLMLCVSKLYGDKRATLPLCNEYWGPIGSESPNDSDTSNFAPNTSRSVSLFKFIRLASEVLPQSLVVPYLKMIAGLTRTEYAAKCAYSLLKDSQSLQATYAVSWDHFFSGLNTYFSNMRSDNNTIGESVYRSRLTPRFISPKETELIIAVMGIVRTVAEHDEVSRIVICEQVNWQTPQVLLGLVACATTVALKGELLLTLAALSKSKETARSIWFHLEESQIIPTIPNKTSSIVPAFSLAEEIVQNECRLETYTLSRGVIQLLYNLMTTHMPKRLGAGPRKAGYAPYLQFVVDAIFLKFNNRAYKDPIERWEVGANCLQLFYFLLAIYRPKASDFEDDRDDYPHPGYYIMLQLQVKSDMLRIVLRIIEEARDQLDDYNEFRGKQLLEECALYALLLLEVALAKQNAFFEAANSKFLLMGLNRMMLDVNPRSRQPDYVHTIIKFVTYNAWLPRHTLAAIKILSGVTSQPEVVSQILNMYAPNSTDTLEIRRRFIECLEMDLICGTNLKDEQREVYAAIDQFGYANPLDTSSLDSSDSTSISLSMSVSEMQSYADESTKESQPLIELKIKEAIVQLFEVNVNQPVPNFVTFLLGIDVTRDLMYNEHIRFESNSCINSLVVLLERHLEEQRQIENYCEHTAHIVERIYRLFHGFCANHQTSEAILRYFRLNCNDFLLRHLSAMPFRNSQKNHMLHAISHLMNCVAIEIRVAASHGQTTRYSLLCDILLAVNAETLHNGHTVPQELNSSVLMPAAGGQYGLDVTPGRQMMQTTAPELHANRVLDCLTLETLSLTQPDLQFFDERLLARVLKDCTAGPTVPHGAGMINIQKFHEILIDELHLVQSTITNGQRKSIVDEITTILQYAINLNGVRMQRLATFAFMRAWCNLVQLLFSVMPETVLPITLRKQHIIDIIEKIMLKVPPTQPLVTLSILVTETVVVLLENLRHCYYHLEDQRALDEHGNVICLNEHMPLNGTADARESNTNANNATRIINSSVSSNSCKSSNLRFILKRLISWLMTCEVKSQKLNMNLYTSLLYCLRIVKRVRSDEQIEFNETLKSRPDSLVKYSNMQPDTEEEVKHKEMAAEIISEFGDKLIDTICHDITTGHAMCSMLALALLDLISELRAISSLTDIISSRGYLKQILYGLKQSNAQLIEVLKPMPDTLRPLFMYESLMACLMQISQTYIGATVILGEGALGILANMSIYDMQPDLKASELSVERSETDDFMPAVDARFRSILLPALSLCDSIIDSLGVRNTSASSQLLNFLFAHIDMIEGMLRAATPFMDLGHLEQLAAITNLFARISCTEEKLLPDNDEASSDDDSDTDNPSLEMSNRLSRLRQLMIVVFGRFTINDATIRCRLHKERQSQLDQPEPSEEDKNQHVKYVLDIAANLSLYCRAGVTSNVRDGMTSKYLLTTMINDVTPLSGQMDSKKLSAIMLVIINQLKGSIGYYQSQKSIADNLVQQRASLPNITFGPSGKRNYLELSQRHNDKRSELKMAVFIAEQNLYLLWIHVDFYFRNAVIYSQENRSFINESSLDPNNMSVLNASQDEITQLKQMLISTFNELFCSQLINASEGYTTKCKNFSAILLRRIKALVQFAPQTT